MNITISTTLSKPLYSFLSEEAKLHKTTKRKIIEAALNEYKKAKLQHEIAQGLLERKVEYSEITKQFSTAQKKSLKE